MEIVFANQKTKTDLNIEKGIKGDELQELKRVSEWCNQEIIKVIVRTQKIADFNKLGTIEEQAIIPDLVQLDRLMRYQTTIQKQFSTAIGELQASTKTSDHRP